VQSVIVLPKTAITAVLDADIGKLHDAPQVDFIAHRPLPDPVGGSEEGFGLFFIPG
jgi:hypothetical protein